MRKEKENKTVINNWNFGEIFGRISIGWLMKFLIVLIIVTNTLAMLSSMITENKEVYNSCTDACQVPDLSDGTLKIAGKEYVGIKPDKLLVIPSCVESCNDMYLKLRNK